MPSGWETYYVFFLSATLGLGIPLALGAVSFFFGSKKRAGRAKGPHAQPLPQIEKVQSLLAHRINTRFFLAANASIVLMTLGLALVPCTGAFQSGVKNGGIFRALLAIVTVSGFAALGLLYSARKGDLGWLSTYEKPSENKDL